MMKTVINFVGGFFAGLVVVWLVSALWPSATPSPEGQTTQPEIVVPTATTTPSGDATDPVTNEDVTTVVESDSITVHTQRADAIVRVQTVTLAHDGWVVVHEERDGVIANALGAARKDAGTYTDTRVPLLRHTAAGQRYWVVLYTDDGDRQFSLDTDFPVRDTTDKPVIRAFNVTE